MVKWLSLHVFLSQGCQFGSCLCSPFFSATSWPCIYILFWLSTGYIFILQTYPGANKIQEFLAKLGLLWLNIKIVIGYSFFLFLHLFLMYCSWCLIKIMQHTYIHFLTIFFLNFGLWSGYGQYPEFLSQPQILTK